jgi:hypothetical protein
MRTPQIPKAGFGVLFESCKRVLTVTYFEKLSASAALVSLAPYSSRNPVQGRSDTFNFPHSFYSSGFKPRLSQSTSQDRPFGKGASHSNTS